MKQVATIFAVIYFFTFSGYAMAELKESLILYFDFEEGKGIEVTDKSANKTIGELKGANVKWMDGKPGKAVDFIPSVWLEIKESEHLTLVDEGTISAWVNIRSSSPSKWRPVVAKGGTTDKNVNYVLDVRENAPRLYIGNGTDPAACYDESKKIDFDKWHFIAGTFDGKQMKLFVDGDFTVTFTQPFKPKENIDMLSVGSYSLDQANNSPNGMIDNVAVFKKALSKDELATIMNGGLKGVLAIASENKLTTTWGNIKGKSEKRFLF